MRDLQVNKQSNQFDEILFSTIKKLQYRFGIKEDGIIGKNLINELNYSIEIRIQSIME